jgi:hypothetical protein
MNGKSIITLALSGVALVALLVFTPQLIESLDNSKVMVIQNPITGELTWHDTGGIKWQGFGTVTKYPKQSQFWFSSRDDQGKKQDQAIKTRFNDGAHGFISGSFSWIMPTDKPTMTSLHTKYGSQTALEQQLIRTVVEKAVYMTGPLMSSSESYASRRNELLSYIDDQMARGVYRTISVDERTKDPMTGVEKTVRVVKLVIDKTGQPEREDQSPFQTLGIKTFGLSFNEVRYDDAVETQIKAQQQAIMDVQTAMANAKKAEQDVITTGKKGEANAAEAKWKQEVVKAQATTEAEQQKLVAETAAAKDKAVQEMNAQMRKVVAETDATMRKNVAELDLRAAEFKKLADIALGEGESQRRKLVMEADGALEKKLDAFVKINESYAKAIGSYTGNWVPTVSSGTSSGNENGAMNLIELLTAKTAKDLAIDMSTTRTKTPEVKK